MKVLVLYRPNSEHAREIEQFKRDYERETQKEIELMNVDTRDGQAKAQVYDIMRYPAFLAVREDSGQALKIWQGKPFPLINELSFYDDGGTLDVGIRQHGKIDL